MSFFNSHTHHHTPPADVSEVIEVLNFHQNQKDKWQISPAAVRSVGLHPWFLSAEKMESDLVWLENCLPEPHVWAVGEAGFDRVVAVPLDLQEKCFVRQVELSERWQKPMILHCVRAFDLVLKWKKQLQPTQFWILHGFNKHWRVAASMLDAGIFLSFGAAIFLPSNHAAQALQRIPKGTFFLENDDKPLNIKQLYETAAQIRGMEVEVLKEEMTENCWRVFQKKLV